MKSPSRWQFRERIERFLGSYPFLLEVLSATFLGLILAVIGFGVGIAFGGLPEALLLSIAGAIVGFLLGWVLTRLLLALIGVVVLVLFPESWWIVLVSACIAFVLATYDVIVNGSSILEAFIYGIVLYVIFAVLCDIALSLWRFIIRVKTWIWSSS